MRFDEFLTCMRVREEEMGIDFFNWHVFFF